MINAQIYDQLKRITEEEREILEGRREIDQGRYNDGETEGSGMLYMDSRKLLESGKLIQIRPHTRFIHFPRHVHNYVEVIYMCSGQTTHIINGDRVVLKEGELLFLSQNAVQEILPAGEEDVAVNFIILPEFFDQALYMIGAEENLIRKFIVGCLRGAPGGTQGRTQGGGYGDGPQGVQGDVGYLHFRVADVLPIQNLVENLLWTIMNSQQNKRSINQFTMGLLFLQLINYTDKVEVGKDHFDQELVLAVYRYIEERYKEGELSELAAISGYDLYWLSRRIKKLTGRNFTELMQIKRLAQAQFLLQNTDLPVADVGRAVGYDNLSYFHRIFREKYGMSPRQWRQREAGRG